MEEINLNDFSRMSQSYERRLSDETEYNNANQGISTIDILHYDPPDFDLPVFEERSTITVQPRSTDFPGNRVPIPVSTVNWRSTNVNHFVPQSGLDFLAGAQQLIIQQTVELHDLLAYVESENRYLVKVPRGETLYVGAETSSGWQRGLCGSARGFEMRLLDQSRQEAIHFSRRFAFHTCCFGCYLQELTVYSPPGDLLGRIKQEWTFLIPSFVVLDAHGDVLYRIEGPNICICSINAEAQFKICSRDGLIHLATISHGWDDVSVGYNLTLTFPTEHIDVKTKALLLGAGFLLQYVYFEQTKKAGCCRACKK